VDNATGTPIGQTAQITAIGYYYFDGAKWVGMGGNVPAPIGTFVEKDSVIGNEVLDATTNGGLVRAGTGTAASPYTLGLPAGANGQVLKHDGTTWVAGADNTGITAEVDGLIGNEFQNLSLTGTTLNISNGTGVTLPGTAFYSSIVPGSDAISDKLNEIYRNGDIRLFPVGFPNDYSTILTNGGGLELYRSPSTPNGNANGIIDFKSNPNIDFEGRLSWQAAQNCFQLEGPSTAIGLQVAGGYKCRAGMNTAFGTSNFFNLNYTTGTATQLWINNTNLGIITVTSDRRLKEAINPLQNNALSRVMQLHPVSFKYKNIPNSMFTGSDQIKEGFIADELQSVIPSAVEGEKDALTSDGDIQPQTLNWAPIVALLTKAIQEQQAQIEKLQQRIEELEKK
jgi:hypothetical protein